MAGMKPSPIGRTVSTTAILACLAAQNLPYSANAQLFDRVIGRANTTSFSDGVAALSSGDIALIGGIYEPPATDARTAIIRASSSGLPIWALTLNSINSYDFGFRILEIPSTDLIAAMYTAAGDTSLVLARLTSAGAVTWMRRYDGSADLSGVGLRIDTSLSPLRILVAGTLSNGSSSSGHLLRVTGNTGALDFNHIYEPPGDLANTISFSDVAFTSTSDYFVTGAILFKGESSRGSDILVARISRTTGDVVWCKAVGFTYLNQSSETGRGIELTASGKVAVIAQTGDPTPPEGPNFPRSAAHFLFDPNTGDILSVSAIRDVELSPAPLSRLSTGQLVACGTRPFGEFDSRAQMWLLSGTDLSVIWRAEYTGNTPVGTNIGHHAIEHLVPSATPAQGLLLAGQSNNSQFNIGATDTLLIRADLTGNDGCAAIITTPPAIVPEYFASSLTLKRSEATQSLSFTTVQLFSTFTTQSACAPTCVGDLNADGFVDDSDFVIFANAYNILDCADPLMRPGCPADFNGDGFVDDADFVLFVAAYNELVCP